MFSPEKKASVPFPRPGPLINWVPWLEFCSPSLIFLTKKDFLGASEHSRTLTEGSTPPLWKGSHGPVLLFDKASRPCQTTPTHAVGSIDGKSLPAHRNWKLSVDRYRPFERYRDLHWTGFPVSFVPGYGPKIAIRSLCSKRSRNLELRNGF